MLNIDVTYREAVHLTQPEIISVRLRVAGVAAEQIVEEELYELLVISLVGDLLLLKLPLQFRRVVSDFRSALHDR